MAEKRTKTRKNRRQESERSRFGLQSAKYRAKKKDTTDYGREERRLGREA